MSSQIQKLHVTHSMSEEPWNTCDPEFALKRINRRWATLRLDFLIHSKNLNIEVVVPISPQLAEILNSDSQLIHTIWIPVD